VAWWQWADSFTNEESPVMQGDGVVDTSNQTGNVWFLAGYFGDWFDPAKPVVFTREITIPSGTALLFPILNGELTPKEWQMNWILEEEEDWYAEWSQANPGATVDEAIEALLIDEGIAVPEPTIEQQWELLTVWFAYPSLVDTMEASLDGRPIKNIGAYRAASPEPYSVGFPENDNHMEMYYPDGGTVSPVVADGWWILVEPLSVGKHTIKFKADFDGDDGQLGMDITYEVTVVPAGKAR